MTSDQLWLEVAKLLVTTAATGVAALFAIKIASSQRDIARRQWATANEAREIAAAKLNLDLFKERLACFNATWAIFTAGLHGREVTPEVDAFYEMLPRAHFLFDSDVNDYLDLIREKVQRVRMTGAMLRANAETAKAMDSPVALKANGEAAKVLLDEQALIIGWMLEQAGPCKAIFGRYMKFGNWR